MGLVVRAEARGEAWGLLIQVQELSSEDVWDLNRREEMAFQMGTATRAKHAVQSEDLGPKEEEITEKTTVG